MQPTLYLFVGFPGAGKSHVARLIAERTGAVHLWADIVRQRMFEKPCHSHTESKQLYDRLNAETRELLINGTSVIFDTNFNYYDDRRLLRSIAEDTNARTVLIWVTTPKLVAHSRAVHAPETRNGYTVNITAGDFKRMVGNLQAPHADEQAVKIDGTDLRPEDVYQALNI